MQVKPSHLQGSLKMREAPDIAGRWLVQTAGKSCEIVLTAQRIEEANAWRLDDPSRCLASLIPGVAGWRPSPEGIELAGADRLTLLVFTATGEEPVGRATLSGGGEAVLRPA